MKIIEALKKIKANRAKVEDLRKLISTHSAMKSTDTSPYANPVQQVKSWVDAIEQIALDNEKLLYRIHKTNLMTQVTIELDGNAVTKSIDEWINRRREGAAIAALAWNSQTDRGLKEEAIKQSDGTLHVVTIVRNYDAATRDKKLAAFAEEPSIIDGRLEIVNATTDLME